MPEYLSPGVYIQEVDSGTRPIEGVGTAVAAFVGFAPDGPANTPTLVLAGGRDSTSRPELCRTVADRIPGALFEVMEQEAHQPFQEVPDQWNARVHAFWREVEEQAS